MGYIKIDRKILDWEWYSDKNTKIVFFHCLLKANWKDGSFMGRNVPRGSFITSLPGLAKECGLSVRNVRTALEHLKLTNELTVKTTTKYSVVTINNYDYYQSDDTQSDRQTTENKQSGSIRLMQTGKKKDDANTEAEDLFQRLWKMYPFIKSGKGSVSAAKKRKIYTEVGEEQFKRCLERFIEDKKGQDPQYIVRASTFFNSTYVDYLDQNYRETMNIIDNVPFNAEGNGQVRRTLQ